MPQLELLDTGVLYRNPKPHVHSWQASFPSITRATDGGLLAAFGLGSAFESADAHTVLARGDAAGNTWSAPQLLHRSTTTPATSSNLRINRMPNGELVANGARWDRSRQDEGLVNPTTLGFVETELMLLRSQDDGHTWEPAQIVTPPLVGPSFEICHPLMALPDGRWLWPTSTWRGWEGDCPHGMQAIALISSDTGATWPAYVSVMDGSAAGIVFWEQKLVPFRDGLLAVCWAHDLVAGRDLPVHYALARTDLSFSSPQPLHLHGQTTTPFPLDDERVLFVYRRTDQHGLWADVGRFVGDEWRCESELPLWRGQIAVEGHGSIAKEMSALRFGLPTVLELDTPVDASIGGHELLVTFWCVEECQALIRWLRLRVTISPA